MLIGLLAALGAAVLFGISAVLQAVAVRRYGLMSAWIVLVTAGYLLGWVLHLVAIALLPLYLAQMAVAGSLAVTAVTASLKVHEPLEPRHWRAIGGMAVGFGLLVVVAGDVGTDRHQPHLALVLYATVAVLVVVGLAAFRHEGSRAGILLGLLAGISYSGAPVATRALRHPGVDVHTAVHGLPIVLFGVIGFLLQSLALERVSVTAATAPMVLLETFVPAVLGVVLFGDGVHHGLWPVAALGFAIATAGALVLSGAEARLDHLQEVPEHPVDAPSPAVP
jgi:drug/metabolite transporter (DMT)-like permease